jgi:hypothetical protein
MGARAPLFNTPLHCPGAAASHPGRTPLGRALSRPASAWRQGVLAVLSRRRRHRIPHGPLEPVVEVAVSSRVKGRPGGDKTHCPRRPARQSRCAWSSGPPVASQTAAGAGRGNPSSARYSCLPPQRSVDEEVHRLLRHDLVADPFEPVQGAAAPARPCRCRRCLLKGCERLYRPTHPQSRYCCETCRLQARRWRRRQASRTWRASTPGRDCRREQCRRYRRRLPLVVLSELAPALPPSLPVAPAGPSQPPAGVREGQRPGTFSADSSTRFCPRPGCYECFTVSAAWSPRRFCCGLCRRALRRVLDREARYRRRRRRGFRPSRRSSPGPTS